VPEKYGGGSNERLAPFAQSLHDYYELCNVTDPHRQVLVAAALLIGAAKVWWTSVANTNEAPRNMAEFIATLSVIFEPVDREERARIKRDAAAQRGSVESYNKYYDQILLDLPNSDVTENLHHYISGLKPAIASHVRALHPGTLLEAKRLALNYASAVATSWQAGGHYHAGGVQQHHVGGVAPMELGSVRCNNCHRLGHIRRNCWSPGGGAYMAGQQQQPGAGRGGAGRGAGQLGGRGYGANGGRGYGAGGRGGRGRGLAN
jgi:hypothetical protein